MMRVSDTSYNFTGLTPDNNYTVTVAGINNADVGESGDMIVSAEGKLVHIKPFDQFTTYVCTRTRTCCGAKYSELL